MLARETIMLSVARRQAGVEVAVADRFVRGVELVDVVLVDGDRVKYTAPATGDSTTTTLAAFRSRALRRVAPPPAPPPEATDLLTAVWAIVGTRSLEAAERLALVRGVYPAAAAGREGDDRERAIIRAWIAALTAGNEPEANPQVDVDG